MLRFILVNNKEEVRNKYRELLALILIKEDFYYRCYKFNDKDKDLEEFIKLKYEHNIYFIIDDGTINTTDIVRKIRNKYHDMSSFIIIVNFNNDKKIKELKEEFIYNIAVLTDEKKYKEQITKIVKQILDFVRAESNCFIFKKNKLIYMLPYNDILYIEKEPNSKSSNIYCMKDKIKINMSLSEIKSILNEDFIQTHRSALVNKRNILKINLDEGKIIFHDEEECYLVSRNYKKIIKDTIPNMSKN